jgi:hypothetical protein
MRLWHNSKKCLIFVCHAGLDPASRPPTYCNHFGFRVKPGMTKIGICIVLANCDTVWQKGIQKGSAYKAGWPPPSSRGQALQGNDEKNSPIHQLFKSFFMGQEKNL